MIRSTCFAKEGTYMNRIFRFVLPALLVGAVLTGFDAPRRAPAPPAAPAGQAAPANWTVDKSHSLVGFKVRHLGITNVQGKFNEYDATIQFDPADLTSLQVQATVQTASIDTENERRDNHLRSDDFFNAEQHPAITFTSKAVRNVSGNTFELVGDLTIRDVTKEVVLKGEYLGETTMRGRRKVGFEAAGTINRFDYNLKWGAVTEAGGLVVSENVQLLLQMELNEEAPATGTAG
jgi:polyisoprenoid-binding protein YceI